MMIPLISWYAAHGAEKVAAWRQTEASGASRRHCQVLHNNFDVTANLLVLSDIFWTGFGFVFFCSGISSTASLDLVQSSSFDALKTRIIRSWSEPLGVTGLDPASLSRLFCLRFQRFSGHATIVPSSMFGLARFSVFLEGLHDAQRGLFVLEQTGSSNRILVQHQGAS